MAEWSEADQKELARLVGKYGREDVCARAKLARAARRGNRPDYALATTVEWIEARALDVGLKKATDERFKHDHPGKRKQSDNSAWLSYRKSIKNYRDKHSKNAKKITAGREQAEKEGRLWRPTKAPRK